MFAIEMRSISFEFLFCERLCNCVKIVNIVKIVVFLFYFIYLSTFRVPKLTKKI